MQEKLEYVVEQKLEGEHKDQSKKKLQLLLEDEMDKGASRKPAPVTSVQELRETRSSR